MTKSAKENARPLSLRVRWVAAIAALIAVFGGVVEAQAATFETTITIRYVKADDYLSGWVRSSNKGCVVARLIRVYRKRPGKDPLVKKFGTYDDGYWRFEPDGGIRAGTYYAKTAKAKYGSLTCTRARTPSIVVPG